METIVLMPVKNEDWVLNFTLDTISKFSKKIIIADNNSSDSSIEISKKYNADIIQNNSKFHNNIVRSQLLSYSREKYGSNNLIMFIDADEFISPVEFYKNLNFIKSFKKGTIFYSPWIQMWKSTKYYRADKSVWNPKNNFKPFMFLDSDDLSFEDKIVINDHTSRVPTNSNSKYVKLDFPLIHLQFANWQRSQIKQVWYECNELIFGINPEDINNKYKNSILDEKVKKKSIRKRWLKNLDLTKIKIDEELVNNWYYQEVKIFFQEYGVDFFKDLNIWDLKVVQELLKKEFKN